MRSSTGGRNKVNEVSVVTRLRKLFKNFLEERLHEVIPNMNHSNWITQRTHVGQPVLLGGVSFDLSLSAIVRELANCARMNVQELRALDSVLNR